MNEQHVLEELGAYSLGILDDDERDAVELHLAGCTTCRAELADIDDVADMLAMVDDDDWPGETPAPSQDDLVLQRTLRAVRKDHARKSRGRTLLVAAAVAGLVALSGLVGAVLGGGDDDGSSQAQPTVTVTPPATTPATVPGTLDLAGSDATTGVNLEARVIPAAAWVKLDVHVTGVAEGERCQLVAVSASGERQVAGSWVIGEKAAGPEGLSVAGSAAMSIDDLARVEIVTFDGEHLVGVDV
jgi:anti-sigma factor RsiW